MALLRIFIENKIYCPAINSYNLTNLFIFSKFMFLYTLSNIAEKKRTDIERFKVPLLRINAQHKTLKLFLIVLVLFAHYLSLTFFIILLLFVLDSLSVILLTVFLTDSGLHFSAFPASLSVPGSLFQWHEH